MKYTVIKTEKQYNEYCEILEELIVTDESGDYQEEIELLTLLIEDWENRNKLDSELDPVELLQSLMEDHGLNQTELADIAGVGRSYISEILNYKKKMSKQVIRRLANHFKIRQEALNRAYGKLQAES